MIKSFEFYFDFASPYSFIAHKQIVKIETKYSAKVIYMPVLLGGLLKSASIKPNADIPIKGRYMIRDCKMCAEKHNIQFKFNNYFPIYTLNLMRCVLIAKKKNLDKKFIDKIYDSIWKDGLNLNDDNTIKKILRELNINAEPFLGELLNQEIKDDLKKRTEDAFNKGIFGVPSFIVNNKLFWGQDRLDFVLDEAKK
tara:strand:- start:158 stop:745 length:588 start_codon:yes stop_codon:yes gene_type:complete